jgi:hypothetical protein
MLKNVMNSITTAARHLLRNWRAIVVFLGLYLALLAALYFFVVIREANIWQVLLTLLLAIVAPVLFFVLQAMGVSYTQDGTGVGVLLLRSLRECWKLIVISVPIVLLAWLIIYLLGKLETNMLGGIRDAAQAATAVPRSAARTSEQPGRWMEIAITALRFLLLGIALPLAAIHLWIATAREGLGAALKGAGRAVVRAFAPRAVLTYAVGLVIFGVIPYFLIFTRTPVGNWWVEGGLLGARLVLALMFVLFGWIITLGALTESITGSTGNTGMKSEQA